MSLVLLRTQSDERLVALTRSGHERAFEAIVKRYRRPLLAAAARMVPEARAEDVLQQALVSAWRALRRGDEVRDLRAWLFRIVRNTAVSDHRRTGNDPPELLETLIAAPSPQEEAERRTVVQETLEAVAGLPERQREALLRIAVQGHSQDEVADELGVSRIAVRQLVHRARTTLRAAASALVPFPLIAWLAAAGTGAEPMSLRIAQIIAGAGGAGAGATLLKAGAVAGMAAAVSAPVLVERHPPGALPAVAKETATATPTATPAPRPITASGDRHPVRGRPVAARGVAASGGSSHASARRHVSVKGGSGGGATGDDSKNVSTGRDRVSGDDQPSTGAGNVVARHRGSSDDGGDASSGDAQRTSGGGSSSGDGHDTSSGGSSSDDGHDTVRQATTTEHARDTSGRDASPVEHHSESPGDGRSALDATPRSGSDGAPAEAPVVAESDR